ncbi:MFS transporter [Nocardioides kongjuensis]|uniref:Putative MFS family arabinose efflux permease n=1 Tax=Nocardioides kongjuensis TaxID=349522 RepID=A0A852RD36_9ACTN|nr:MFS transporter [Nocardioides kongjuensis]NYD31107.1 putative MFS family arabinose efflux permease [Nocardioides kongjuensis]
MPSRQLAVVLVALSTAAAPPFLVGALAAGIDRDLGMSASAVGFAVGLCYLVAAAVCTVAGPWVDRIGAAAALRVTFVASSVALAVLAAAPGPGVITVGLLLQGFPVALSQPAANLVLSALPPGRRRGLYFGIVQAAIPASILVSGLMLGTVAGSWGWRTAFVLVAVLAALGAFVVRVPEPVAAATASGPTGPVTEPSRACLVLLGLGGLLGSATATVLPAFAASAALDGGLDPGTVGTGIVVAGLACVGCRVTASWLAGHVTPPRAVAGLGLLLASGVLGYAGLAVVDGPAFLVFVAIGYGLGWGWPGVFNLAVTAARPRSVGAMTGRSQAALFAGGMLGPTAFGIAVDRAGYPAAWAGVGVLALLGAACFALAALLWRSQAAWGGAPASELNGTQAPSAARP